MTNKYTVESIIELSEIDHIRHHPTMYIGDTETPTHLFNEVLDNALDEVQAGYANKLLIQINTKDNWFSITDNGRGFPFDENLPLEKDPPVLSCIKLFTSGKFRKGTEGSAYKIAVGLHGIGLVSCYALSDYMTIEIIRDGKKAKYTLAQKIDRQVTKLSQLQSTGTTVLVKPSRKYFKSLDLDLNWIKERLFLASSVYKDLEISLQIDDSIENIKCTEEELIKQTLFNSSSADKDFAETFWIEVSDSNSKGERYRVRIGWASDIDSSYRVFSSVNLCVIKEGIHINKVLNDLKDYMTRKARVDSASSKYSFAPQYVLSGLKLYMVCDLIKASYAEQSKKRLSNTSDISILNSFVNKLDKLFQSPEYSDKLIELFDRFQEINNRKLSRRLANNTRAGFTKLRDCYGDGGELFIVEGESAGGALIQVRDPKIHAVLPLRGVIPNAVTKKDLINNKELRDIMLACGCDTGTNFDPSKLKYDKVIIATDSDPAGHWISALLIVFFAAKMPKLLELSKLYICKTPLYGYKVKNKLIPIWSFEEAERLKKEGKQVLRFKGLGEFNPEELKTFTLDEDTRWLIRVDYEDPTEVFHLMSNSEAKRQLLSI